jgi:hypothetical protein
MQYAHRLLEVRKYLLDSVRGKIQHHWDEDFPIWLNGQAPSELGHWYLHAVNQEFSMYTTPEINDILWVAGKSLVHAIAAFMKYRDDPQLDDLLAFVELFIIEQMEDFDNWCEEIRVAMCEEEYS